MSEGLEDESIAFTMGIDVFRNVRGYISIKQQDGNGLVEFTDGEAFLLLQGLAREMGYRLVKEKKVEGGSR